MISPTSLSRARLRLACLRSSWAGLQKSNPPLHVCLFLLCFRRAAQPAALPAALPGVFCVAQVVCRENILAVSIVLVALGKICFCVLPALSWRGWPHTLALPSALRFLWTATQTIMILAPTKAGVKLCKHLYSVLGRSQRSYYSTWSYFSEHICCVVQLESRGRSPRGFMGLFFVFVCLSACLPVCLSVCLSAGW